MISESIEGHNVTFNNGVHSLKMPFGPAWGTPNVFFDGNKIPSARLWAVVANAMMRGESTDRKLLMSEAQRADIYRLQEGSKVVWTRSPRQEDTRIEGNVYERRELQRYRCLVDDFNVILAKIEEDQPTKEQIQEVADVMAQQGYKLFAYQEKRLYFSKNPKEIYSAFGTRNIVRLAVYFKRPSSSALEVNLVKDLSENQKPST